MEEWSESDPVKEFSFALRLKCERIGFDTYLNGCYLED